MYINQSISYMLTARELLYGIFIAAKSGGTLPRLTLMLPTQFMVHRFELPLVATLLFTKDERITLLLSTVSRFFIWANIVLNALGYTLLVLLYRHSVQTIFNRKVPTMRVHDWNQPRCHPAIQSFNVHLLMLRPLEIMFRFLTAPLRVLPDVIILGETRCGTTTLCGHIASLSLGSVLSNESRQKGINAAKIKVYPPFCPWEHPELDHKESFYFVGHYLGFVHPYFYRMAFPLKVSGRCIINGVSCLQSSAVSSYQITSIETLLMQQKITRWWEEKLLGNFFFTFDGCAQYLNSPTAPYLIARAYGHRNKINGKDVCNKYQSTECNERYPPILVACTRNPVDQAVSWWKYENNAISWGETMGLNEWNSDLRSIKYPPKSIGDALYYSKSEFVLNAYSDAESLVGSLIHQRCSDCGENHNAVQLNESTNRLPPWAMTWPCGQMSTIGRGFSSNIQRYNNVFKAAFGSNVGDELTSEGKQNPIEYVHIVPLESQTNGTWLRESLRPILSDVVRRSTRQRKRSYSFFMPHMDSAVDRVCSDSNNIMSWRNTGVKLTNPALEPSDAELALLHRHFGDDDKEMNRIMKRYDS